jgi:hypothetical protein
MRLKDSGRELSKIITIIYEHEVEFIRDIMGKTHILFERTIEHVRFDGNNTWITLSNDIEYFYDHILIDAWLLKLEEKTNESEN